MIQRRWQKRMKITNWSLTSPLRTPTSSRRYHPQSRRQTSSNKRSRHDRSHEHEIRGGIVELMASLSVAPQFDHETRTCKLDCINLTTGTAKCPHPPKRKMQIC